nr:474_t:CDS:2 [Entrophospora candida]
MRVEHPDIVFLPCMAHQFNLIVGEIFKESDIYKKASAKAVKIVSYFHSSPYFTGLLRNEQISVYGKTIALITPSETRWNSYYFCFHSVLKTEAALRTLSTKFAPRRIGTPSISRSGHSRQRLLPTSVDQERHLPSDIITIINEQTFWNHLFELQDIILPLCAALNKLQKDMARLYEVVLAFGWIFKVFSNHENENFSNKMINRLEKRWNKFEQPLLLLSLVLHPQYRTSLFKNTTNNLSYTYFGQWINYYYQAWFGTPPIRILREYLLYQKKAYPFDMKTFSQLDCEVVDFWDLAKGEAPELSKLALHLHGICINSASVERLWSNMGFIHSKKRNRLYHEKVLGMCQLRSEIFRKKKQLEIKKYENLYKRNHIAIPIQPYNQESVDNDNEDEPLDANEVTNDMTLSDDNIENNDCETLECFEEREEEEDAFEEETDDSINRTEHWVELIQNWMNMIDDNEDISDPLEFIAVDRSIHPADDPIAKWSLHNDFMK